MAGEELVWQELPALVDEPAPTGILDPAEAHARIDALEHAIRAQLVPMTIEPVHHFAEGIYAREITIPAGALLTGKIHRTRHINIVSQGAITVFCVGEAPRLVVAPATFVAEPGARRVGLAHEDTVWTTIHANPDDTRDLDLLETRLIEPRQIAPADLAEIMQWDGADAAVEGDKR